MEFTEEKTALNLGNPNMKSHFQNITLISCSLFRREIDFLRSRQELELPVVYINSMLHIYPEKLQKIMDKLILREVKRGQKIVLLYGECHAYISDYLKNPDVERVKALNCIEIILGKEQYKIIQKERIFCFMPEWINRWEDIFKNHLGLNRENARAFMKDMHSKALYIDTGAAPIPSEIIQDIQDYIGLDMDIMTVNLNQLLGSINQASKKFIKICPEEDI